MTVPGLEDDQLYIWNGGNLYCQTLGALQYALTRLRQHGYTCIPTSVDSTTIGLPPRYYWEALNESVNKGKCNLCHHVICGFGLQRHGRTCEHCSQVIYRWIIPGSVITFDLLGAMGHHWLRPTTRPALSPRLVMKVASWNDQTGQLDLEPHFIMPDCHRALRKIYAVDAEAQALISRSSSALSLMTDCQGRQIYRTFYRHYTHRQPRPAKNRVEVYISDKQARHSQTIQIWDGVQIPRGSGTPHAWMYFQIYAGWRNKWTTGCNRRLMWAE